MFSKKQRKHSWPRCPLTHQTGMLLTVFGVILLLIVLGGAGMILVSMLPLLTTLLTFPLEPMTTGVVSLLLLMTLVMVGIPMLLLVLLCGGIVVWGLRVLGYDTQLREHGVVTQSVIIDRWAIHSYRSHWHCVAYHFTAILPDGSQRDITRAERNANVYWRVDIGVPVTVCYLPEKPEICRIETSEGSK